jgi:hypothetical protein
VDFVLGVGWESPGFVGGRGYRVGMSSSVETPTTAGRWWRADDTELRTALTDMQTTMRRNYHAMLEMVREADSRGLAGSSGYPNLPALLADMLRIPVTEAKQWIEQARLVIPAPGITSIQVQPPLARTGQASAAGLIGADHVAVIASTMAALPSWVDAGTRECVETTLVRTAHSTDAKVIKKLGGMILARLDQDGPEPRDDDLTQQPNELRTHTSRNGRMRFTGDIDPEAAALFTALLGPLAKPRPADVHGRDPRDTPQRLGDAFVDILRLAAGNDDVPSQGGEKPTVVVTVPLEVLEKELGTALLDGGTFLSAAHARMLACDCRVVPVVLGSNSEPLDIGRAERTIPLGMRRALVHRDRGCAFPQVRPPREVVSLPPHSALGERWRDETEQPGARLHLPPPATPLQRVGSSHRQRQTRILPPTISGSRTQTLTQPPPPPTGRG